MKLLQKTMMDDIKEELNELGGDNFDEHETEEKREIIKDALQFNSYTPSENSLSPCETEHTHHNPAIEAYCNSLSWDDGWRPVDRTEVMMAYPEYVPTDEAIETLCQYNPILEIGAGAGYWAFVLDSAGCEILPTDICPKDVEVPDGREYWEAVGTGENNFITLPRSGTHSVDLSEHYDDVDSDEYPNTPWYEVAVADHTAVKSHPNHTILSCHPPAEGWTEEMLDFIAVGQKFVFIGEWYPGPDAMPMFFKRLIEWDLIDTFPVYDWGSMHAHGYVFEKPTAEA